MRACSVCGTALVCLGSERFQGHVLASWSCEICKSVATTIVSEQNTQPTFVHNKTHYK